MKLRLGFILLCASLMTMGQGFKKTIGFEVREGFFTTYYDEKTDQIFASIPATKGEFLYVYSLSSGVGNNDLGLDRGQLGNEQVVFFDRRGNKLLLTQPNMNYRANSDNLLEQKSITQAFAKSVLFGFEIIEENTGNYLIDLTPFLLRDAHGVIKRLKDRKQGTYNLDKSRSALNRERTKNFPQNTEFDVLLTFTGDPTGNMLTEVVPNPEAISISQHHSFIELPPKGFKMRKYDPRCGAYPFHFYDYATPVDQPTKQLFVPRHRLEKKDPTAAISEAVEPIIYYLDNGTPEPIRSALLEGGRWWNQAFEAIGFKDAFQVKILPDDADPMDVRYNVIQWVHRSTRGWSYGASVRDPRTGEIIKGHVSLGSLRIRQDYMIAQAFSNNPFEAGKNNKPMLELALARIRQLSAHEIGHTLGFAHNFAASTNDRASVMDYPHPIIEIINDSVDFSQAYSTGIGEWDKVTVAYAYSDFPITVNEDKALQTILEEASTKGLRYLSDQDGRPISSASPITHLWDNGKNSADELLRILAVRKKSMANFSEKNVDLGTPNSVLEDVFVPLYFSHRYQTEAVVKTIGGVDYAYKVIGDNQINHKFATPDSQRNALKAFLKTLNPETLAIPLEKLKLFPPRSIGFPRTRESFKGKMGVVFDPLGAAETAASNALTLLLQPERANRLVFQVTQDESQLSLKELIKELIDYTLKNSYDVAYFNDIQHIVQWQTLQHLMQLAANENSYPQVTEAITFELMKVKTFLSEPGKITDPHAIILKKEVESFLGNPRGYKSKTEAPTIPDGSPIGMDCFDAY